MILNFRTKICVSLISTWMPCAASSPVLMPDPLPCPPAVRVLDPVAHGLPKLPALGLSLLHSRIRDNGISAHLAAIIRQAHKETLPEQWIATS
jgi:hypothetical protein